jgi:prepilin-type N-terminal cleavage/methylation domain-containing protein
MNGIIRVGPVGSKGIRMMGLKVKPPGFSLLELILALGLVSLVVLFSNNFLITVIQTNAFSQNRTAALALAQEKIEDLKARPVSSLQNESESGITNGNLNTLFGRETAVAKSSREASWRISVRVTWPRREGGGEHQVALTSQLAE